MIPSILKGIRTSSDDWNLFKIVASATPPRDPNDDDDEEENEDEDESDEDKQPPVVREPDES